MAAGLCLGVALADALARRRQLRAMARQVAGLDSHFAYSRTLHGVAHNLRNHLQNAQGALQEVEAGGLDAESREMLRVALTATSDAASVLESVAGGAGSGGAGRRAPVDLAELGATAVSMGRPAARRRGVRIVLRAAPGTLVPGDALLLREVASNLVVNAVEASPRGGLVTVTAGGRGPEAAFLSVADGGRGVAEGDQSRLFEPRFTTKPGGSGLGLYTSFGIVLEHRGRLLYEDAPGGGALFTVVLPRLP